MGRNCQYQILHVMPMQYNFSGYGKRTENTESLSAGILIAMRYGTNSAHHLLVFEHALVGAPSSEEAEALIWSFNYPNLRMRGTDYELHHGSRTCTTNAQASAVIPSRACLQSHFFTNACRAMLTTQILVLLVGTTVDYKVQKNSSAFDVFPLSWEVHHSV